MKLFAISMLILFIPFILMSQEEIEGRFITVTGSADIYVQPDKLSLDITLQEIERSGSGSKIELSMLEDKLMKVLSKNQVPAASVAFKNANMDWYYWWRTRKSVLQRKTYTITLDTSVNFLQLVQDLDFNGVESIDISNSTSSRIQELRKEVKIEAVKAAKEKARYLLESIGEKVGKIVSIEEIPEQQYYYLPQANSNVRIDRQDIGNEIEGLSAIKLRYEIKAKFEIQ